MCGWVFLKFSNTEVNSENGTTLTHNGGDWRSKSLALPFMFSTTLDGFYFANCVLADALFRIIN